MSFSSAEEVLSFIEAEKVEFVDVRFIDLPGTIQHFTVPVQTFDADVFTEGRMFDGSSIRGFQQIHESDMLLLPDPSTAVLDPFRQHKTLNLTFSVYDPLTGSFVPLTPSSRNTPAILTSWAFAYRLIASSCRGNPSPSTWPLPLTLR